jgi:SAM-dependent methyltransferase
MFHVAAEAYDRFMGRYSSQLSPQLADYAGVQAGQTVLDVGCGPGALTAELVRRVGAKHVAAVDPSPPFVAAMQARFPDVDVRQSPAEQLPFRDDTFDSALAQLVVHFMADPVAGLREMARVTRPHGVVAACVWDYAGGHNPLEAFWVAVRESDPGARDESALAGAREGHLVQLMDEAGLSEPEATTISASVEHATFEAWWELFTLGVGPAGAYVAALDDAARIDLRERCRAILGGGPFVISAQAWAARGRV